MCGLLPHLSFALYSERVITSSGVFPAVVIVDNGKIQEIELTPAHDKLQAYRQNSSSIFFIDYGKNVIMPGLVDVHVHLNEPGREDWEGFASGTKAAAAGGVTTVVDMPINSRPAVTTAELLQAKVHAAKGKLSVDCAYWGGLVPANGGKDATEALEELLEAGAVGLKAFMCDSGMDDFPAVGLNHIRTALRVLQKQDLRKPLMLHAELVSEIKKKGSSGASGDGSDQGEDRDPRKYSTYAATRPRSFEARAIEAVVKVLGEVSNDTSEQETAWMPHVHIAHLADAKSLPTIRRARLTGLSISVETCPHYLTFAAEDIPDGSTLHKCAPPIRNKANRELLWAQVTNSTEGTWIDMLSSDHSPAPPELKHIDSGDFLQAWGGISGLQFSLPVTWTEGQLYKLSLERLSELWSSKPAAMVGLTPQKGSLIPGADADMVVWDPDRPAVIGGDNFPIYHRHKGTPYAGMEVQGMVLATFVRGHLVYLQDGGALGPQFAEKPCGQSILKH
eukprot:jgi/Mesvir1/13373/Mv05856-RA.1